MRQFLRLIQPRKPSLAGGKCAPQCAREAFRAIWGIDLVPVLPEVCIVLVIPSLIGADVETNRHSLQVVFSLACTGIDGITEFLVLLAQSLLPLPIVLDFA